MIARGRSTPRLVIVSSAPDTGKTTLARCLVPEPGLARLSKDEFREATGDWLPPAPSRPAVPSPPAPLPAPVPPARPPPPATPTRTAPPPTQRPGAPSRAPARGAPAGLAATASSPHSPRSRTATPRTTPAPPAFRAGRAPEAASPAPDPVSCRLRSPAPRPADHKTSSGPPDTAPPVAPAPPGLPAAPGPPAPWSSALAALHPPRSCPRARDTGPSVHVSPRAAQKVTARIRERVDATRGGRGTDGRGDTGRAVPLRARARWQRRPRAPLRCLRLIRRVSRLASAACRRTALLVCRMSDGAIHSGQAQRCGARPARTGPTSPVPRIASDAHRTQR